MRGRRRDAQVRVVGVGALRRIPLHRPRRRHPHRTGPSKRAPTVEPRNGPSAEWTLMGVRACVRACVCGPCVDRTEMQRTAGAHFARAQCVCRVGNSRRTRFDIVCVRAGGRAGVLVQDGRFEEDEIRHCMCAGGRAGGRAGVLVQDGRFEEDEGLMQELAAMDAMQADTRRLTTLSLYSP